MNPTIRVDTSEWQRAAKELSAESKRTLPEFLNGQMMFVLDRAIKMTRKANAARIEYQMGQVATGIRTIKRGARKGQMAKGKRIIRSDATNSLAWRIYWKVRKETGRSPLPDYKSLRGKSDPETIVRAMIAHKVKSVAMLAAGWLKAFNTLRPLVKGKKPQTPSAKTFGSGKKLGGWIKPAVWRIGTIEVTAANEALGYRPLYRAWFGGGGNPMKVASDGLQSALNASAQDMIAELAKRLKQKMAKNGMR